MARYMTKYDKLGKHMSHYTRHNGMATAYVTLYSTQWDGYHICHIVLDTMRWLLHMSHCTRHHEMTIAHIKLHSLDTMGWLLHMSHCTRHHAMTTTYVEFYLLLNWEMFSEIFIKLDITISQCHLFQNCNRVFFFYLAFLWDALMICRSAGERKVHFYSTLRLPSSHEHSHIYLQVHLKNVLSSNSTCVYKKVLSSYPISTLSK